MAPSQLPDKLSDKLVKIIPITPSEAAAVGLLAGAGIAGGFWGYYLGRYTKVFLTPPPPRISKKELKAQEVAKKAAANREKQAKAQVSHLTQLKHTTALDSTTGRD